MKKLIFLFALCVIAVSSRAQNITINNNVAGSIHVYARAIVPNSCGTVIDYAVGWVPAFTSGVINLNLAASWIGGVVPTAPYEIEYAAISRDPSCPGSLGWGTYVGPCYNGSGFDEYYDEITLGDPACGYNTDGCLQFFFIGSSCGGHAAGDVVSVTFTPGGNSPTIDVNP